MNFSSHVKSIALATPSTIVKPGDKAVVTGWGQMSVSPFYFIRHIGSRILSQARVNVLATSECFSRRWRLTRLITCMQTLRSVCRSLYVVGSSQQTLTGFWVDARISAVNSAVVSMLYAGAMCVFQAGGSNSKVLQVLTMPVIDQEVCKKIFARHGIVTPAMLCAGYTTGGKDTCHVRVTFDSRHSFLPTDLGWVFLRCFD